MARRQRHLRPFSKQTVPDRCQNASIKQNVTSCHQGHELPFLFLRVLSPR